MNILEQNKEKINGILETLHYWSRKLLFDGNNYVKLLIKGDQL